MEKMAHEFSRKIAVQLHYDEDKEAVIAYGLTAIFQIAAIAFCISVIGLLCRFWYEALIIFAGVGILKKSTGGAHSQTIYSCTFISVLSISLFAALSRYLFGAPTHIYMNYCAAFVVFVFCGIIFYKNVPVDSPNKPIKRPEKIKRLRRQSFILLVLYTAGTYLFIFFGAEHTRLYSFSVSIHFVLLWQAFMLTKSGAKFIKGLDTIFTGKEVMI